jgi:hypothetical protein
MKHKKKQAASCKIEILEVTVKQIVEMRNKH